MYDLYKPLRNHVRQISMLDSLRVVWSYMQYLQIKQSIPADIEVDRDFLRASPKVNKGVFEWELDILAKEIILNSPDRGTEDFRRWRVFSTIVNELKRLESDTAEHYASLFSGQALVELYRIAHRQFPWQVAPNPISLTRFLKIFGHAELDPILENKLGLSANKLYVIGLCFYGHYSEAFGMALPVINELPGINDADIDHFLAAFSTDIGNLKEQIEREQSYNEDYAYAFNPLRKYPLISVEAGGKKLLIAPVPTHLFRRFTEGVYYELYNAPGFSAAFGTSFQAYVGDVLRMVNLGSKLTALPEAEYWVGKDRKDSVDWIVSDETAHIFLECKTKRIRFAAKIALADQAPLEEDLKKMAECIVQTYKTLDDALRGKYAHWRPSGRPVFPFVVTLDDWYIFSERLFSEIDSRVRAGLADHGVDETIMVRHPYSLCSVQEFERAIQVMAEVGIESVMQKTLESHRRRWHLHSAMLDAFREQYGRTRENLFPDDLDEISPA